MIRPCKPSQWPTLQNKHLGGLCSRTCELPLGLRGLKKLPMQLAGGDGTRQSPLAAGSPLFHTVVGLFVKAG